MGKFDQFKTRLEDEKQRLERMIESRRASVTSHDPGQGINESFSNSGDDEYADAATDTFNQELDVSMLNKYKFRITRVDEALGRFEQGSYGTCIRCHQKISEGRLDAVPETPYCRDCEADVEVQD
jgi:RNA polymerase-binding transcription factor DksA